MSGTFFNLASKGVQGLHPYQPGKPIEELERELGVSDTVKLASNENPLGASPLGRAAIDETLTSLELYPDGNGFTLKNKLAEKIAVTANQITLGNGSNDVLELVARAFLTPETEAIFSEYAFAVYPIVTQATGATAKVAAAYSADHAEMPYGHDLDAMLALISDKTRVIFIANPNNPTGTWLSKQQVSDFLVKVPSNIVVVMDEAYFEYVNEEAYPDSLEWLSQYNNLIVTRTFSKIYGLAGLRIGYSVSNEEIADLLNRVRQPFNANSIALAAATAAVDDVEHVVHSADLNREGLAMWMKACDERGLSYIPSVGNFITVDMGRDAGELYEALLREAIIVRPVANYGLPNHLRITIGTTEQNKRCIAALDKVLSA